MDVDANKIEPVASIQHNVYAFKNGQLDFELLSDVPPPTPASRKPYSPLTVTPIRQGTFLYEHEDL